MNSPLHLSQTGPYTSAPCLQPRTGFPSGGALQARLEVDSVGPGGCGMQELGPCGNVGDRDSEFPPSRLWAVTLPLSRLDLCRRPSKQEPSCPLPWLPTPPPMPFCWRGISGKLRKGEEEVGEGQQTSHLPRGKNSRLCGNWRETSGGSPGWVKSVEAGSPHC